MEKLIYIIIKYKICDVVRYLQVFGHNKIIRYLYDTKICTYANESTPGMQLKLWQTRGVSWNSYDYYDV